MKTFQPIISILSIALSLCAHQTVCAQDKGFKLTRDVAKHLWQTDETSVICEPLKTLPGLHLVRRVGNERGFMLVYEDETLPLILAYDKENRFSADSLPAHIQSWMDNYGQMRLTAKLAPDNLASWLRASSLPVAEISPLLGETQWGQDTPYNIYCPTIGGKPCPTGCVATALAQVMRYYGWPQTGNGSVMYFTSTAKIPVSYDFSSATFDWQNMQDTYRGGIPEIPKGVELVNERRFVAKDISVDYDEEIASICFVKLSQLTILGASGFSGKTAMVLANNKHDILTQVSSDFIINSPNSGQLLKSTRFQLSIPADLPDDTYNLYNVVYSEDSLKWRITDVLENKDIKDTCLVIDKRGTDFTIDGKTFPCSQNRDDGHSVATLMQAVGAAVKMDYNIDGSGSNDLQALYGMKNYLNYDADMFFAYPEEYTGEQWHRQLQSELSAGHPVYYTGQGEKGGHAFVIDGMQKDSISGLVYYHVNWGWDGMCNGYYLLNMLKPVNAGTGGTSGDNYSHRPSMLIGMIPENGIQNYYLTCKGLDVRRKELFAGQAVTMLVDKLVLRSASGYTGDLKVDLFPVDNADTQPVTIYFEPQRKMAPSSSLTNYYMPTRIPLNTPSGTYNLVLSFNNENGDSIDVIIDEWPQIRVRPLEEWPGGNQAQPMQAIVMSKGWQISTTGNAGELTIVADSLFNPLPVDTDGRLAMLICDKNGAFLKPLFGDKYFSLNGYAVRRQVSVNGKLSKDIPDGDYILCVGFLPSEEALWTFCDQMIYENDPLWADYQSFGVSLTVRNGHLLVNEEIDLEGADIPWTSSICNIANDVSHDDCIFDLSGRKTKAKQRGIYILRRNNKSVIIVK